MEEKIVSKKRVLIAGGSGFIGSFLTKYLKNSGYDVAILSRDAANNKNSESYYWNIQKGEIQEKALNKVDCIINLAGENISSGKWTASQKIKIEESRTKSAEILFDAVKKLDKKPESYISASAIGFYGTFNSDKIFSENDKSGDDFLADICRKWEHSAMQFQSLGIRTTILRTGVVFSELYGAFPKITQTLKFGFVSEIGSGNQYMPWIHINDLVKMYRFAIENGEMKGIYNAVSADHINQNELVAKIRNLSNKKFKAPNIPAILLKAIYGEMASILLYGSRVSADKILKTGFEFDFPNIHSALGSLLLTKAEK